MCTYVFLCQKCLHIHVGGRPPDGGCTPSQPSPACPQIRREVEVQLAGQVKQAQQEQRRAAQEAARLEQQLRQQSAQVLRAAASKDQAQARK